jgi:hypothetical protein
LAQVLYSFIQLDTGLGVCSALISCKKDLRGVNCVSTRRFTLILLQWRAT